MKKNLQLEEQNLRFKWLFRTTIIEYPEKFNECSVVVEWDQIESDTRIRIDHGKMFGPQKLHKTISTPNLCDSNPNAEIVKSRGYKPSDRKDPQKREFLVNLSKRIWHMVNIKSRAACGRNDSDSESVVVVGT